MSVTPVDREVLIEAARLRALHRVTLPDAVHLATASIHGCAVFLTNDRRIRAVPGLEVVYLADAL